MRAALVLLVALALLLVAPGSRADQPVIEEAREKDVLGLFAPYTLGAEVSPGWRLWNVAIQPTRIVVVLKGPTEQPAELVLVHPNEAPDAERTPSFAALAPAGDDPQVQGARDALLAAVRRNDDGKFWRAVRPLPMPEGQRPARWSLRALLSFDGVLLLAGLVAIVLVLAGRVLWSAPRWVRFAVPAISVVGLALRLALAPASLLGAWPWSRAWPHWRTVFESPRYAGLVERFGAPEYMTELSFDVGLVYAALTPLVLFSHATQLLRDARAGAFVAFAVAFSPHHIRFSRCEDAFVPSIVLTSTAFALLHTWLRDRSASFRWASIAALPIVLWPAYLLRPLNILFIGVYIFAAALLHTREAPRHRRLAAVAVVAIVGAAASHDFYSSYTRTVGDALGSPLRWLVRVPTTFLSPELNVLLQPALTPPVLVVCVVLGFVALRKRGDDRLAWFLLLWLGVFFVSHAYVVDAPMQPRYHLHLLVPFLLLAGGGAVYVARRSRAAIVLACAALVITPLLARDVIADVGATDQREYAFVHAARDLVPEGCSVVEYVGDEDARDARFGRIGVAAGVPPRARFRSVAVRRADGEAAFVEAVERADTSCVYVYEGIDCWGAKERNEPYAPACAALDTIDGLELVAEETVPVRVYDRRLLVGVSPGTSRLKLRLRRLRRD